MESPRASKRRKLDTPTKDDSSPRVQGSGRLSTPANGSLKRPSKRNAPASAKSHIDPNEPSPFHSVKSKKTTRSLPKEPTDVYDDIDGALENSASSKRPRKQQRKPITEALAIEEDTINIQTKPIQSPKKAPAVTAKRGRGRPRKHPVPDEDLQGRAGVSKNPTSTTIPSRRGGPRGKTASVTTDGYTKSDKNIVTRKDIDGPDIDSIDDLAGPELKSPSKRTTRIFMSPSKGSIKSPLKTNGVNGHKPPPRILLHGEDGQITDSEDPLSQIGVAEDPLLLHEEDEEEEEIIVDEHPIDNSAEFTLLKKIILEKLMGRRSVPLVGLDDEYNKVYSLVEQTVNAGEGNSMLLIGARGSGKSALIKKVISEVSKDHREEFHIIRLSGFIHTDDKLALREIWRQLGKEMDLEEDGLGKNYADTLAKLLALLSHPSELSGEESEQVSKAVIFVIDEFDLFATHPRQTLLYNLFDIAQSRKAPIAVLGLTTRINVSESLEKRVKSRFSHRYVHLSLSKTFTAFQEICKSALLLHSDELDLDQRVMLSKPVQSMDLDKTPKKGDAGSPDYLSTWNTSITALFSSPRFIKSHLSPHYHLHKSIPTTLSTFLTAVSTLTFAKLSPSILSPFALQPPDSLLTIIPSLSTLALSLLIAAARLDVVLDTDTCNFNLAYAEYTDIAGKARIASAAGQGFRVWGKEVARKEWDALVRVGFLIPVGNLGGNVAMGGGGTAGMAMVRCDTSLEEIGVAITGQDRILERWCRQL